MRKLKELTYVEYQRRIKIGDTLVMKWANGRTETVTVAEFSTISNEPISTKGRHVFLPYVWKWPKGSKVADKKKQAKQPAKVVLKFEVDPYQGIAGFVANLKPPKGYRFANMVRNGKNATVTYEKEK